MDPAGPSSAPSAPQAGGPAPAGPRAPNGPVPDREVNAGDRIFKTITAAFGVVVIALLAGLALQMVLSSGRSFREFGLAFITGTNWDPVVSDFGALPFIFGTVVSSLLALLIAVPIAIGVAIFLAELAPSWLRGPVGFVIELLAAIPSVVYGLWGFLVLAPWLRDSVQAPLRKTLGSASCLFDLKGPLYGTSMMAAGLILAVMVLPTIAAVSRDVMRAVPVSYREAALALGATQWETVRAAVLPYARSGILGAVILGLGRALGETMAVTMVIGNKAVISCSLLSASQTMASVIANEFREASDDLHLSALAEIGLLLLLVTVTLNIIARLLVWRVGRLPGGART